MQEMHSNLSIITPTYSFLKYFCASSRTSLFPRDCRDGSKLENNK
jgi:hypothetical protein